jgi:hypothetical protein
LKGRSSVWRSERTGLLWSDIVAEASHCAAAGNVQNLGYDCSANTESLCAEIDGLSTPDKVGFSSTLALEMAASTEPSAHESSTFDASDAKHLLKRLLGS